MLSGQSTLVEFDGFGMDPDGDVVTLDRIVSQPERGSATISADGTSIVYSSVPGHRGQVSFRYRVVDALGETGEGTVRIGVLDGQSNPSPITFTDYVQVQAGEGNTIRVSPLSNDVDPTRGRSTLTDVRPDLPGDARRRQRERRVRAARRPHRLAGRHDGRDRGGRRAGDDGVPLRHRVEFGQHRPRAHRRRGRARERARLPGRRRHGADAPRPARTSRAASTCSRTRRPGRAATSPTSRVALWGEPDGVTVDGDELRGALPATTRVIPFAVTGEGAGGRGHDLRVPARPRRRRPRARAESGARPPEVTELESVSFDMADLVAKPRGAAASRSAPTSRASGARADAACAVGVGHRRALRLRRRGAVGRRVPGAGADGRAGGLDLPVGADPGACRSTRSRCCGRVDDGRAR